MLKLVIVVFLSVNLFSKDFLELYRTQGINAVEKELEKSLRDVNSWKKYLENKNVDYGFYETKAYVIVAQKNNKEMSVFAKNGDDFKKISKDNMIIGEKAGDKYLEGDKKTPEGSYDLVQKRTGLDQFYGPLALVTSYPNNFDQSLNKKGHGIWIHGMPLNGDRENYTQGCLALNNEKLKELEKNIDYKKTVLITSGDEFKKAKKEDIALFIFENPVMYSLDENMVIKKIVAKQAVRYETRDEMYYGDITLNNNNIAKNFKSENIKADFIVKKGAIYNLKNNVKYKRDDFIKIDTKEMIYDDLNKIAKNSSPFKAEYYAHKYNGENLYLESEKNIINSKNTHFEIDIEKRKGKNDKK